MVQVGRTVVVPVVQAERTVAVVVLAVGVFPMVVASCVVLSSVCGLNVGLPIVEQLVKGTTAVFAVIIVL